MTAYATGTGAGGHRCQGCHQSVDHADYGLAVQEANRHASSCRATDVQQPESAVELARDMTSDLRAELPRIDSRAAAGVALAAAILVAIVSQTPTSMPIYALSIAAAALLTISILLFLAVLLPTPILSSHGRVLSAGTVADAIDRLVAVDRARYFTEAAMELAGLVQVRQRRLRYAFLAGLLGLLTLAAAATTAVALGY